MNKTKVMPTGCVRITGVASDGKPPANSVGVSATVVCVDAAGVAWSFLACSFVSELNPYNKDQPLTWFAWRDNLHRCIDAEWILRAAPYDATYVTSLYREGKTPEEATQILVVNYRNSVNKESGDAE